MMNAGERLEALKAAGFAVERVESTQGGIGMIWLYYPPEAVSSAEAQALIATFEGE